MRSDSLALGIYSAPLAQRAGRLNHHYTTVLAPRDESYMRQLFAKHYPQGKFVNADKEETWRQLLKDADAVVLLYPDAIGFGFSKLERETRKLKSPLAALRFLNGRTRTMLLSRTVRRQLALRRLIIRFFVFELLTVIPFFAATLWFACVDVVRGRNEH
jgi:hypothetical protein